MIRHPIVAGLLCIVAAHAAAQTPGSNPEARPDGRRAPLALPDDLAPAVDVGGLDRGAAVPPEARASATDAAPASASPAPGRAAAASVPAAVTPGVGRRTQAMDTLDLGTTSITGNQELPKVLYIVPWKRSDLGDLAGRPVNTLLDEVLTPIDPEVFERQLEYFDSLYGTTVKE